MTNFKQYKKTITGVITARKCECCGHHEIGITTQKGKYILLKPGITVKIIEKENA